MYVDVVVIVMSNKGSDSRHVDGSHTFEDMANGSDFYSMLYSPLPDDAAVLGVHCVYTPGMEVVNKLIMRVERQKRVRQGKVMTSFISSGANNIYKLMISSGDVNGDNYNRMMALATFSPNVFVRYNISNIEFKVFSGKDITIRVEKNAFNYLNAWAENISVNKSSAMALSYWIEFNTLAKENSVYRDLIDANELVGHDASVARRFLAQFIGFNDVLTCLERNGFLYAKDGEGKYDRYK